MAFTVHEIAKYNYSFSSSGGGAGTLQLWSLAAEVVRINFVDDDAPLPPPTIALDLSAAVATFRLTALAGLVDMLRNEKPVRVTLNDQAPGFIFVHTGTELVGEGEKR